MTIVGRICLAVMLLLVDFMTFFIPLGAILFAYVVIFRPKWFKSFIEEVYKA